MAGYLVAVGFLGVDWLVPYFCTNKALRRIPPPFPGSFMNF